MTPWLSFRQSQYKVLISGRNVGSDGAFLTDDGKLLASSTHVPKPLGRHGHGALNVWWTVPPEWLCQQVAEGGQCRRQMSTEA